MTLSLLSFGPNGWGGTLLMGAVMSIAISVSAFAIGLVVGSCAALAANSKYRLLRLLTGVYTTVFRGIPELLVIYLFFFGSSSAIMAIVRLAFGYEGYIEVNAFLAGALAIGLISGAYTAEVIRGAIGSVPPGQMEAAFALGMKRWLVVTRVLFPQALRTALPGLNNVWQLTLKESALVSVIGLADVMRSANLAAAATHQPLVFYIAAASIFLVFTYFSSRLFSHAESRAGRGQVDARS